MLCKNMSDTGKKCFVISPIGEENSDIRKRSDQIFTHVIEKAVNRFGYSIIRADKDPRPGIITSQIIEHLVKDELVIADLTYRNPNVFYELAIRHFVKKPFIQIKEVEEIIPFDIANMRTINADFRYVDSMEKCKDDIIKQIEEIENNPDKVIETPVCFTIDYLRLKDSDDSQSKLLTSVVSQMNRISSELESHSKQGESKNIVMNEVRVSIDDTERDEKVIINKLMLELCRRNKNTKTNEYNLDEIINLTLGAFSKEYVYQFILKFESKYGYIQVLPDNRVLLTEIGEKNCQTII